MISLCREKRELFLRKKKSSKNGQLVVKGDHDGAEPSENTHGRAAGGTRARIAYLRSHFATGVVLKITGATARVLGCCEKLGEFKF